MLPRDSTGTPENANGESLAKTRPDGANREPEGEEAVQPDSNISRDAQAQSEWEAEAKRIQEIRNLEQASEILEHELAAEPDRVSAEQSAESSEIDSAALLETVSDAEVNSRISFEEFTDERILTSHDAFGNKQMKIKVLEVSDETPPVKWKFGDRVKVTKILVTIKHLTTQEVEEGEFDIEAIERELQEKRHYTSTNRWIPASDIKNGYVVGSKHTRLISDASALDYIMF